ncbi:MAG: hypothetical protein KC501_40045 [Myxococcales bacterium]|nr:hypothetical protein [Myxococcales bacterium]
MFLIRPLMALVAMSFLSSGCDHVDVSSDGLPEPTSSELSSPREDALVDFLADYELSSEELLDEECGLRSDAANNIDRYRRGPDERYGTDDDRTIDSELALDSIRQVGPSTIEQLYACAEAFGYAAECDDELDGDCEI